MVRPSAGAVRLQLQELAGHDVRGLRVPVRRPAALCVRDGVPGAGCGCEAGGKRDDDDDDDDGPGRRAAALDTATADRHSVRVLCRHAGLRVPGRRVREPRPRAVRDAVLRGRHRRRRVPGSRRVRPPRRMGGRRVSPVRPRVRAGRLHSSSADGRKGVGLVFFGRNHGFASKGSEKSVMSTIKTVRFIRKRVIFVITLVKYYIFKFFYFFFVLHNTYLNASYALLSIKARYYLYYHYHDTAVQNLNQNTVTAVQKKMLQESRFTKYR